MLSHDLTLTAGQEIETFATSNAAGATGIDLTGNKPAQTITGNAGSNRIDGNLGNDTLTGVAAPTPSCSTRR